MNERLKGELLRAHLIIAEAQRENLFAYLEEWKELDDILAAIEEFITRHKRS